MTAGKRAYEMIKQHFEEQNMDIAWSLVNDAEDQDPGAEALQALILKRLGCIPVPLYSLKGDLSKNTNLLDHIMQCVSGVMRQY